MEICPNCGSPNFYDQYHQAAFPEHYAMCKNCGYWKREGEEAKRCNIFYHECKGNKRQLPLSGHPRKGYCWGFGEKVGCEYCDEIITKRVEWPSEDPNHPLLKF